MPSSDPSVLPSESDYEAICAAVMETLRGRWFLAEYARRNRHSDTKVVLTAIERIEMMIRGDTVATPAERFRNELADMAKAIARTKSEIAAIKPEAEQPGKILEASEELDSIVHTTEKATSSILAAAEQVQEIAWTVREQDLAAPICDQLDALATDIYTACSFQDLTGQRIQKVIHAMRYLEERIDTMIEIWDEGVSAQNGSAAPQAAPAAAKAAAQPAHHDVTQDDLDQTDVDMVMDPAQQEAAVKAETGRVTIDHEPQDAAEPAQSATATPEVMPEAVATPQSFAPEGVVPESAEFDRHTVESHASEIHAPESQATESQAAESVATESAAPESVAPESVAVATFAAEHPTAESLAPEHASVSGEPEETPVFFRAMEPGPVAKAAPSETLPSGAPQRAIDDAAAPIAEAVGPQTTAAKAGQPELDLGVTIAAVREALFAFPGLAVPRSGASDAADELAPVGDDEPAADLYEPAPPAVSAPVSAAAVEDIASPEPVEPAHLLLEPLPQPGLRALAAVAPFAEHDHDTDAADPKPAASMDLDIVERPVAKAIAAETSASTSDESHAEAGEADDVIETVDLDSVGIAPVIAAAAPEPVAAEESQPAEPEASMAEIAAALEAIAPESIETEAAVIEAVSPEAVTAEEVSEPASAIASIEAEAPAPATAEAEAVEAEAADIEASAPEVEPAVAVTEAAHTVAEIDIVEIAEIEAVATAPMAPEPVAEVAEDTAIELDAKADEPEPAVSEPEAAETTRDDAGQAEEERPAARTMMPEVTFASTAPVMMPMETTRTEPAEQRFAAAATATPTQDAFIPFGHVQSAQAAASAPQAQAPQAPERPIALATPSIYSTSPYLEPSRSMAAAQAAQQVVQQAPQHAVQADPLAAITALTDDEKVALFS